MKIFQLICTNKISSNLRYAEELYNGILQYFNDYQIDKYNLDNNELSIEIIDKINTYDYLFIHNLGNNKDLYLQLINDIKCKKILFITDTNFKKFILNINQSYIEELLLSFYKIVLNVNNQELVNNINKLTNNQYKQENIIQLNYIYNGDPSIINYEKDKEIIQISNKGLKSKYELFIDLFEHKQNYFDGFIWKIYGVEKNIQTLSIDKLFIDKKTNTPSNITNFDNDKIDNDKINVYKPIEDKYFKSTIIKSYFACCFDNYDYINYTILDIIYNGIIPVFNIKYAKKIKVNDKQSLYDIIDAIYIDDSELINNDLLVNMNKYIKSINTYKSIILRNINKCNQLFNSKINIEKLIKKIL